MVYDATKDIHADKSLMTIRKEIAVTRGQFEFDPDSFKEEAKYFKIEDHYLSQEDLIDYAKIASRLRQEF